MTDILSDLFQTIESRKNADADTSYTAALHHKGKGYICQKVGEEATEMIVAALSQGKHELISEIADFLYHMLVLLSNSNINITEVMDELARRYGISGLMEKQQRLQSEEDS